MTPHIQTEFCADEDWLAKGLIPGNCVQTAVASWLDLDPADVPHFLADERPGAGWWEAMRTWARETRGEDFTWGTPEVAEEARREISERNLWGGTILAGGRTVRDTRHMVVVRADTLDLVHDPHPSGEGLAVIEDVMWLTAPYDPSPDRQYADSQLTAAQ